MNLSQLQLREQSDGTEYTGSSGQSGGIARAMLSGAADPAPGAAVRLGTLHGGDIGRDNIQVDSRCLMGKCTLQRVPGRELFWRRWERPGCCMNQVSLWVFL